MVEKKATAYRVLAAITMIFMLISLFPAAAWAEAAEEGQDHTVVFQVGQLGYLVGGQQIASDVAPYIKDDRTMVPVAFVAPALGTEPAEWLPVERQVIIKKGNHEILITIDSEELIVDGQVIMMDTAAEIKDIGNGGGRTMLPISFVARALEVGYAWQAETRSVYFYGYNKICDQAETIGPELETETIQGNVIIKANGVKMQNLNIKGNLIIAEEVGQGTVTLDNVSVGGETYIRGGGPDSIYINGGQYNNIFVAKILGKVRIVAVDADGAAVILTEETGDNEVILEGSFDSVIVAGKGITLTTLGETTINNLIIEEQAEGSVINLSSETIVTEALLNTEADFNNEGRIISAVGTAAEVSVYDHNLPENFITPSTSSSGGGGSVISRTAAPVFEPEAGEITAGTEVEISTTTSGASIYYTIDGSTPSSLSTLYEGPITINEEATIKAIAVKDGRRNSQVVTASYTVINSDFAGGAGTEADPYQVATAEQLDNVRNYRDKHFIQTANIDLGVSPWNEDEGWVPIGGYLDADAFNGSFDGNGFVISNLTIDRTGETYSSLFGRIKYGGTLENISLENISVRGQHGTAGLAGYMEGASISNCYVTGTITGTSYYAGGLVGTMSSSCSISDSYSTASVYGGQSIGGLVGFSMNQSDIINCHASGDVDGTENIGGLAGKTDRGTITDSYAAGDVTGSKYVGGLVGLNTGSISGSYADGEVSADDDYIGGLVGDNAGLTALISGSYAAGSVTGDDYTGGLAGRNVNGSISDSYATGDVSGADFNGGLVGLNDNAAISRSYAVGALSGTGDSIGGLLGLNVNDGTISSAYYDTETTGRSDDTGKGVPKTSAEMSTQATFEGWDFADIWDIEDSPASYPYLQWQTDDIPYPPSGFAGGDGSEADPYEVATAEQLDRVRDHLDKHFIQTADIDLDISPWNEGEGWEPIGDYSDPFTGTYDGDSYEITGLTIERSAGSYHGLFGATGNTGVLSDLTLESVDINGYNEVGSLVGDNKGIINDCYAEGSVSGNLYIGILVGDNREGGYITRCYTFGHIEGEDTGTGGLVGANGGTVSQCYSAASVTGSSYLGGLVGFNTVGTISDSYGLGDTTGTGFVGGLVGGSNASLAISNCYAAGTVFSSSDQGGGLIGYSQNSVINSYYDSDTTGQSDTGKGTPKTSAEMTAQATFDGWDFDNTWDMEDSPASYPYLQWQTDDIPYPPSGFAGGSGTEEDPYQVATAEQLDKVRNHLDKYFIQTANIDLDASPWNEGEGWEPIGDDSTPFTCSYDGDGYEITGLTINRPDTYLQGLFGYTGSEAELSEVNLEDVDISAYHTTGALVGINEGSILDSSAAGAVSGINGGAGGLVGRNIGGTISGSYASGTITSEGDSAVYTGGLVGENRGGTINSSHASASAAGYRYVGGLVGWNDENGSINNSYATGDADGTDYIGGLAGGNGGIISSSYASGSITSSSVYVGGLVGNNGGTISSSYASGSVTSNSNAVGGLVGVNYGEIDDSYASASVTGNSRVGGLVGANGGTGSISSSYAAGAVAGSDSSYTGGLAGYNTGSISDSYYDTQTTGQSDNGMGTPKTTIEMVDKDTFSGWDFEDTWGIGDDDTHTYPYFQWQDDNIPAADIDSASPMGRWAFDDGTGTQALDSSGNDYHGTINGAVWTTDRDSNENKALEFGENKWVDIPDTLKPDTITLSAWIYITGTDGSAAPIFSAEEGHGATGFAYRLQITPDAKLRMEAIAPYSTSGARVTTSPDSLNLNQWYHVAGTYDGVSTKIYIDGSPVESDNHGTAVSLNSDTNIPVAIGHLQGWSVQWFRGKIDDARIYDGVLTLDQIQDLAEID